MGAELDPVQAEPDSEHQELWQLRGALPVLLQPLVYTEAMPCAR